MLAAIWELPPYLMVHSFYLDLLRNRKEKVRKNTFYPRDWTIDH